jgi:hypothetical protein
LFEFLNYGQCHVVLSPSLFRRQRKVDFNQIQIESGEAGVVNGRINLLLHNSIIGGLDSESKVTSQRFRTNGLSSRGFNWGL